MLKFLLNKSLNTCKEMTNLTLNKNFSGFLSTFIRAIFGRRGGGGGKRRNTHFRHLKTKFLPF